MPRSSNIFSILLLLGALRFHVGFHKPEYTLHKRPFLTPGHKPGEHGVWPKTRETGGIDSFSLKVHWGVGPRAFGSYGTEIWRPPSSFPSSKAELKALREKKLPRANSSRLLSLAPVRVVQFHLRQRPLRITERRPSPRISARTSIQDQVHRSMWTTELQSLGKATHSCSWFFPMIL